jgi:hypothetical protein
MVSLACQIFINIGGFVGINVVDLDCIISYLIDFLSCFIIQSEESFFFLSDEHKTIVIVTFLTGCEFDVGDEEVIVFILSELMFTLSSLVLNHSLALPSLTGILNNIVGKIKYLIISQSYLTILSSFCTLLPLCL